MSKEIINPLAPDYVKNVEIVNIECLIKIIAMASDHAGFELKQYLVKELRKRVYNIKDMGTYSDQSVDYPDVIHPLAEAVSKGKYALGIIMCGSGNGVSMVANKYPDVRCALCWNEEVARLARNHNNANIVALPARFISHEQALKIVETFLTSQYEGGRHQQRVDNINK